ncbi:prepilin peptidase dependent protein A [Paraglaciecola aquimarina]|uniref:Type II secretion system protein H n=1 Tax=Paraglaciecola aquimarina TaxID=1235557 RepID=A0ABU3T1F5_9ALTE|nr:GspH/FimT family pseudopilin [Paraglaciecola aquimarina]MDU0356081.1 prepilin peptidase dependent protein A [Paraglaciecola aquimarina]
MLQNEIGTFVMFTWRGLTILELLFTISITLILLGIGAPAFHSVQRNIQLKSVVENLYYSLQKSRAVAISRQVPVTTSFTKGKAWCVGTSDLGICDCNIVDSCTVNGVEQRLYAGDYSFITLTDIRFGKDNIAVFDGVRGLAVGHAGSVIFSDGVRQLKLILSNMGRVRICAIDKDIGGYKAC